MASLRDIRKRIASVKNTQKITKAMKMVAAAKLRRAEEAIKAGRPFSEKMREVMMSLAARTQAHPMLESRPSQKALLILVTADRGLCGAFNTSLQRRAEAFLKEMKAKSIQVDLLTVGRKGNDYFRRRQVTIVEKFNNVMNSISYDLAGQIVSIVAEKFLAGEYQSVYVSVQSFSLSGYPGNNTSQASAYYSGRRRFKASASLLVRAIRGGHTSRTST